MEQDYNLDLLTVVTKEMDTEILINEDATGFWKKTQASIFDESLPSFREGLAGLTETLNQDKEAYNYFSSMVTRVMTHPSTAKALEFFVKGFDIAAADPVLGGGFNYKAADLSPVGQLILFISVNRNLITLALYAQEQAKAPQTKKGRK